MTRPAPALLAVLTVAALVGGAGCAAAQDAAEGAVQQAACSAVDPVADQLSDRIDEVVADIAVDPAGAVRELTSWRDGVAATADGVGGGLGDALDALSSALDSLTGLAQRAADGVTVTPEESDELRQQVREAVAGVLGECE